MVSFNEVGVAEAIGRFFTEKSHRFKRMVKTFLSDYGWFPLLGTGTSAIDTTDKSIHLHHN